MALLVNFYAGLYKENFFEKNQIFLKKGVDKWIFHAYNKAMKGQGQTEKPGGRNNDNAGNDQGLSQT
jgi:hypothetical protein